MPDFSNTNISTLIANIALLLREGMGFLTVLSAVMAVFLILVAGKMLLDQSKESNRDGIGGIIWTLIAAAGLGAIGASVSTIEATVLGPGQTSSILSYRPSGGNTLESQWTDGLFVVLMFVQLVGYIAIIRGWLMLRRIQHGDKEGDDGGWRITAHFIGGAMCTNIIGTLSVISMIFFNTPLNLR
jgi:hypothetical protein